MPYEADDVLQRHAEMKSIRAREEGRWRELALLFAPDDLDFDASADSDREDSELFDSVTLQAKESFIGGMFNQGVNPATRWFGLTLGDNDRASFRPVKEWLWRRTNQLYASCAPAASAFYSEMPAVLATLGVFGNGYLSQEELIGQNAISDRSRPIGECFVDFDAQGNLHTFHREFALKGRHAKAKFAGLRGSNTLRDDATIKIVHCVRPNMEYRPNRVGAAGMLWASTYASPDEKWFRENGGFSEMPYHVFQWNRRSKRAYATGPGHIARPDAATNNESERSYLVAEQFGAEPPILTSDESAFSAADVVPNAVLEGAWRNGKPEMGVLERKQKMDFGLARSEARRNAIRAAFLFSVMQLQARPQMTATEFLGFQEEFLKLMGPNLVRIQVGGLTSFIARRYRILERAGAWQDDPPPPELQGRLEIKFVSPLDKLQQVSRARGTMQWVTSLAQVAAATGRQDVMDNVDEDATANVLHSAFTEEPSVLRDPRQVAEIRKARAAQMQGAQQLEQTGQAVSIAAEAAHAQQAGSLAKQRSTPA